MPFLYLCQNLSNAIDVLEEFKVLYAGAGGGNRSSVIVHVQKEGDKDLTSLLQVSGMSFGHDLLTWSVIANIEENA